MTKSGKGGKYPYFDGIKVEWNNSHEISILYHYVPILDIEINQKYCSLIIPSIKVNYYKLRLLNIELGKKM